MSSSPSPSPSPFLASSTTHPLDILVVTKDDKSEECGHRLTLTAFHNNQSNHQNTQNITAAAAAAAQNPNVCPVCQSPIGLVQDAIAADLDANENPHITNDYDAVIEFVSFKHGRQIYRLTLVSDSNSDSQHQQGRPPPRTRSSFLRTTMMPQTKQLPTPTKLQSIRQRIATVVNLNPSSIKFIAKGKLLHDNDLIVELLLSSSPSPHKSKKKNTLSATTIMVMGTRVGQELQNQSSTSSYNNSNAYYFWTFGHNLMNTTYQWTTSILFSTTSKILSSMQSLMTITYQSSGWAFQQLRRLLVGDTDTTTARPTTRIPPD